MRSLHPATFLRTLSLSALLLGAVASCTAQEQGPCLTVEGGVSHDFGDIRHADKPQHRFVFTNACTDTVRFTAVKASCSCTAALPSNEVLAPGASAEIAVTFYPPRSSNGHVSKSVSVYVDDEPRPRFVLRVAATIVSSLETEPAKIVLGEIRAQREVETVVRVTNVSDEAVDITAMQSVLTIEHRVDGPDSAPQLLPVGNVVFTPAALALQPGQTGEVAVRFTPQADGKLMGSVILYAGPEARQVEILAVIVP